MRRFRFIGLLPAKKEQRRTELEQLKQARETLVILEAPYRLRSLLADLSIYLGGERRAVVACNLTMENENIMRGNLRDITGHFQKHPFKGEFVVMVEGKQGNK